LTTTGFRILPRIHTSPSLLKAFEGLPASIISDCLHRLSGTRHLLPRHRPGLKLLGTALTVRVRSGDNLMIHKALQLARPGDVLVVDGGGVTDRALIGDIMKNVARSRGVVGAVVDGTSAGPAAAATARCSARSACAIDPTIPTVPTTAAPALTAFVPAAMRRRRGVGSRDTSVVMAGPP